MNKTVAGVNVASRDELGGGDLPDCVLDALSDCAGEARESLLALSVQLGLKTLSELMELELDESCGVKGRHNCDRKAYRHGYENGSVTLGGRRVSVRRPRARTHSGKEIPVRTYEHFAKSDELSELAFERILAGVSARKQRRIQEAIGAEIEKRAKSQSKSTISRKFIEKTGFALEAIMNQSLSDMRLVAVMIDGMHTKNCTAVIAMGITTEGRKVPIGLWDGSTENATVVTALLSDLVDRGLDVSQGVLCVIDGAKALKKAITDVFGTKAPIQRCIRHKERNVLDHLPEKEQDKVKQRLRAAWSLDDYRQASKELLALAHELKKPYPGASKSLCEGLNDTLTVTRLGVSGSLKKTLQSTNPIESMIACVRRTSRQVTHWQSGEMVLRWTAAGLLEAKRQSRRISGSDQLAQLSEAIEKMTSPRITFEAETDEQIPNVIGHHSASLT